MMENRPDIEQENESTPQAQSDMALQASIGKVLREKRESLGFSIADVANQIKFAPRQIESLEADDFRSLPETAFLRGFVRSYAKILQLDAEALLLILPKNKAHATELQVPESVGVPFPNAHSVFRPNIVLLAAAGLVAILAAGFAMWNYVSPRTPEVTVKVETPLVLPQDTEVLGPTPETGERIPLAAATEKIDDADGRSQTVAQNTSKEPRSSADIEPTTATAVKPTRKPEVKLEGNAEKASSPRAEPAPVEKEAAKPVVMLGLSPTVKPDFKPEVLGQKVPAEKLKSKPAPATDIEAGRKQATDSGEQVASKPVAPASNQSGNAADISKLRLEFDEESWTEIRDRDDNIISSQVNQPGSVLVVRGRAPFKMLIGHGLSVRLFHQDKQVDLAPYINKYSEVAHVTVQ